MIRFTAQEFKRDKVAYGEEIQKAKKRSRRPNYPPRPSITVGQIPHENFIGSQSPQLI